MATLPPNSKPVEGGDDRFPAPAFARAVLAPAFGLSQAHHLGHLMTMHRAHGVMLHEQGLLSAEDIASLLRALAAIEADLASRGEPVVYTGEHEDLFFYIERELARHVGVDTAARLHTGRSRNDIDHTLFKMALKERLDALVAQLTGLTETLIERSVRDARTIILAYTHGQPAQPSTYGHYLGAVIETLLRDAERLEQARQTADLCPMGAAAITTTGFPLDRARVAELLGFAGILPNSYGCIASADYTSQVYATIKLMALNLGRFAQDMAFWTSFEVGQLRFSDGFVQISSIMPQKRNPVPVEHMRLMASLCAGRCEAVLTALHNTPFTDMNDNEHEVHSQGYEAFAMAARVLDLMQGVAASATIDEARARANIARSFATITELADTLVREEGIPFGRAHHVAAQLARVMKESGDDLGSVPYARFAAAFAETCGRAPKLSEARFREAASPENFIAVRKLPGGPAPEALAEAATRHRAGAKRLRDRLAAHAAAAKAARDKLAARTGG
jgi:argininosuccinate lyase